MSTNFYARIIPSQSRKKELIKAIETDKFDKVEELYQDLYGKTYFDGNELHYGLVHLGQRSAGWKFLWNPNLYKKVEYSPNPSTPIMIYELNNKSIKEFIDRNDVIIIDEYNNVLDKEAFWNMAITWCQQDGYDMTKYIKENGGKFHSYKCNEIHFLKELEKRDFGIKLCGGNAEFYSDGLRFSSTNEFS